jgi:hypothetical protein
MKGKTKILMNVIKLRREKNVLITEKLSLYSQFTRRMVSRVTWQLQMYFTLISISIEKLIP